MFLGLASQRGILSVSFPIFSEVAGDGVCSCSRGAVGERRRQEERGGERRRGEKTRGERR